MATPIKINSATRQRLYTANKKLATTCDTPVCLFVGGGFSSVDTQISDATVASLNVDHWDFVPRDLDGGHPDPTAASLSVVHDVFSTELFNGILYGFGNFTWLNSQGNIGTQDLVAIYDPITGFWNPANTPQSQVTGSNPPVFIRSMGNWAWDAIVYNNLLYVGTAAVSVPIDDPRHILWKFDGVTWAPVNSWVAGLSDLDVHRLEVWDYGSGPMLFIMGRFAAPFSNIMRMSTSETFFQLGAGVAALANTFVTDGTRHQPLNGAKKFYFIGNFSSGVSGGLANANIARWDPATDTLEAVPGGTTPPFSSQLFRLSGGCIHSHDFQDTEGAFLFTGGVRDSLPGDPFLSGVNQLLKFNETTWEPVGEGMEGLPDDVVPAIGEGMTIYDMETYNTNELHVVGVFGQRSHTLAAKITWYDSANDVWLFLDKKEANNGVWDIIEDSVGLLAAGDFTEIGGVPADHIALYTQATDTWSEAMPGLNGNVHALVVDPLNFDTWAGGSFVDTLRRWDAVNSVWLAGTFGFADGTVTPVVNTLMPRTSGGSKEVYIGGTFDTANVDTTQLPATVNNIIFMNAGPNNIMTTRNLNAGVLNLGQVGGSNVATINTIVEFNGEVYIGGAFDTDGATQTVSLNSIAKLTVLPGGAFRWDPLVDAGSGENGVNGVVYSLSTDGTRLYAFGDFLSFAGNNSANSKYRAAWNGVQWQTIENIGGPKPSEEVRASTYSVSSGGIFHEGNPKPPGQARGIVEYTPVNDTVLEKGRLSYRGPVYGMKEIAGRVYTYGNMRLRTTGQIAELSITKLIKQPDSNIVQRHVAGGVGENVRNSMAIPNGTAVPVYRCKVRTMPANLSNDGGGSRLLISGVITVVSRFYAEGVAAMSQTGWIPGALGGGVRGFANWSSEGVHDILDLRLPDLEGTVVAGNFGTAVSDENNPQGAIQANSLAMWIGDRWVALGSPQLEMGGLLPSIEKLLINADGKLVAIGNGIRFPTGEQGAAVYTPPAPGSGLCAWEGTWAPLGNPSNFLDVATALVRSAAFYAGNIIVLGDSLQVNQGGTLSDQSGSATYSSFSNTWNIVPVDPLLLIGLTVHGAETLNNFLYAVELNFGFSGWVLRWTGSGWTPLGQPNPTINSIYSIARGNFNGATHLFVGAQSLDTGFNNYGRFDPATNTMTVIGRIDGASGTIDTNHSSVIETTCHAGGMLFGFLDGEGVNGTRAPHMCFWNNGTWIAPNGGANATVSAFAHPAGVPITPPPPTCFGT